MARIAIIGTGFAGLGAAIRLKEAGIDDFVVLERAANVGGTWRDNSYPGISCDIPAHIYAYSFELNPRWTRGFAPGGEIQEYLRRVAEKHGVLRHIRFEHEVTGADWDEGADRWRLSTAGGDVDARFVISASGTLSEPREPDIPGLGDFEGRRFHSARWDHEHDLTGERVAVIGTGASAIQFVPEIQPRVERLHVFQRTAQWVLPRLDHGVSGIQKALLERAPAANALVRDALYWLVESRVIGFRHPRLMKLFMEPIGRWHLERQVRDPALRAKLRPEYTLGCKRTLLSNNWFPALGKPNVEVVTDGIERVTKTGVVTRDGEEREVDTIIFGTGFCSTDPPIAARIRGRDGRTLREHWFPKARAYKGTTIAGFPNLFFMTGPNTTLAHGSMVPMMESQLNYVLDGLRVAGERRARAVEVRPAAQRRWNEWVDRRLEGTVWTAGGCRSWYLDERGHSSVLWPSYSFVFDRFTRRFDPEAYDLAA
ncbi:MAG TPA: NAD(P)/FAD-dependent oxidoreductase [Thermoleophilaceae bacterium]